MNNGLKNLENYLSGLDNTRDANYFSPLVEYASFVSTVVHCLSKDTGLRWDQESAEQLLSSWMDENKLVVNITEEINQEDGFPEFWVQVEFFSTTY